MNLFTQSGFLGTEASFASDMTLVAFVLLIVPAMIAGFVLARRREFFYHQMVMTVIVIFNWVLIFFVMVVGYVHDVAPNVPAHLDRTAVWLPTVHLVIGGIAQLLATYLVLQMWFGPNMRFHLMPFKRWMRLTFVLWLITAAMGVGIYINYFGLPFAS